MIIYQINLPKKQDKEVFIKFMKEEYIPAMNKWQSRAGRVTSLALQQSGDSNEDNKFLWQVGWEGVPNRDVQVTVAKVKNKFEAFGAKVKRLGTFTDVANWEEDKA